MQKIATGEVLIGGNLEIDINTRDADTHGLSVSEWVDELTRDIMAMIELKHPAVRKFSIKTRQITNIEIQGENTPV